jgi:hypothetical protein
MHERKKALRFSDELDIVLRKVKTFTQAYLSRVLRDGVGTFL